MTAAYPLGALLRLRRGREEAARGSLASALGAAARAGEELRASLVAAEAGTRRREDASRAYGGPAGAAELQGRARFLDRLREIERELVRAAGACERAARSADAEVERCRDALAASRRAVRTVERHRERWEAERRRDRDRREERESDDAVSARAAGR